MGQGKLQCLSVLCSLLDLNVLNVAKDMMRRACEPGFLSQASNRAGKYIRLLKE